MKLTIQNVQNLLPFCQFLTVFCLLYPYVGHIDCHNLLINHSAVTSNSKRSKKKIKKEREQEERKEASSEDDESIGGGGGSNLVSMKLT